MYLDLDKLKEGKQRDMGRKISWVDIQIATDIRLSTLYAYKNIDWRKRPNSVKFEHLKALCDYFCCDVGDLFAMDGGE